MQTDIIAHLFGSWSSEINIASTAFKTALVIIMSAVLGCERAQNRHAAGLRTLFALSVGALFAGIADMYFIVNLHVGFSFLSAAVLIGASIITANTIIFSSKNQIKGLTTSVDLITMSVISSLVGFGLYTAALVGFVALMVGLLGFSKLEKFIRNKSNHLEVHLELKTRNNLQEFIAAVREFGLKIENLEVNPAYTGSGLGVYTVKLTIVKDDLKKTNRNDIIEALSSLECVNYIERIA